MTPGRLMKGILGENRIFYYLKKDINKGMRLKMSIFLKSKVGGKVSSDILYVVRYTP